MCGGTESRKDSYEERMNLKKVCLDSPFIVFAYCAGCHWYLLLADTKQHEFFIINPMDLYDLDSKSKWFHYFLRYFDLDEKTWTLRSIPTELELPAQNDTYNCGIFIIMYVDIIFANLEPFEVEEARRAYQLQLLCQSLPVYNDCLFCGKDLTKDTSALGCDCCLRWFCKTCLKSNYDAYQLTSNFICFLCTNSRL
jgi:Ulp1 protease family, C-terminal catalytic domain